MRPDLEAVDISEGELKRLPGVEFDLDVYCCLLGNLLTSVAVYIPFVILGYFIEVPKIIAVVTITTAIGSITWAIKSIENEDRKKLINLLNEVNKYNAVIKAINVSDELEEAGNLEFKIDNRIKLINALEVTRSDIVRALKTEKVLRLNKDFIASNQDMFANNLLSLTELKISDQSSQEGRLLDEALQIAVNVQQEMRKLQNSR